MSIANRDQRKRRVFGKDPAACFDWEPRREAPSPLVAQKRSSDTAPGVQPIAPVQWGRANFWSYGVVEPANGWHFAQEYDTLNSTHFQSLLDGLSQALGDDTAVLQLDQARDHQALALRWSENMIPIFPTGS